MANPRFPPGWTVEPDGKKAGVSFETEDFLAAIRLFEEVARVAEDLEHHPDLHLEQWNRVRIVTWSHDAGGLTDRDERLARALDPLLRRAGLA